MEMDECVNQKEAKYSTLKKRRGSAVAYMRGGRCGSCGLDLRCTRQSKSGVQICGGPPPSQSPGANSYEIP